MSIDTTTLQDLDREALDAIDAQVAALLEGLSQGDASAIASRVLVRAECPAIIWQYSDFLVAAEQRFDDPDEIRDAADFLQDTAHKYLTDCTSGWEAIDMQLWNYTP